METTKRYHLKVEKHLLYYISNVTKKEKLEDSNDIENMYLVKHFVCYAVPLPGLKPKTAKKQTKSKRKTKPAKKLTKVTKSKPTSKPKKSSAVSTINKSAKKLPTSEPKITL